MGYGEAILLQVRSQAIQHFLNFLSSLQLAMTKATESNDVDVLTTPQLMKSVSLKLRQLARLKKRVREVKKDLGTHSYELGERLIRDEQAQQDDDDEEDEQAHKTKMAKKMNKLNKTKKAKMMKK